VASRNPFFNPSRLGRPSRSLDVDSLAWSFLDDVREIGVNRLGKFAKWALEVLVGRRVITYGDFVHSGGPVFFIHRDPENIGACQVAMEG